MVSPGIPTTTTTTAAASASAASASASARARSCARSSMSWTSMMTMGIISVLSRMMVSVIVVVLMRSVVVLLALLMLLLPIIFVTRFIHWQPDVSLLSGLRMWWPFTTQNTT
ncbi:hypothetical protein B0O80DRAFT_453616 [Mortierella sp. GBAus27b]|nr:hypothetical protein B0O80DRAFT_453616 [Mortierella sp. GBAus27b]